MILHHKASVSLSDWFLAATICHANQNHKLPKNKVGKFAYLRPTTPFVETSRLVSPKLNYQVPSLTYEARTLLLNDVSVFDTRVEHRHLYDTYRTRIREVSNLKNIY